MEKRGTGNSRVSDFTKLALKSPSVEIVEIVEIMGGRCGMGFSRGAYIKWMSTAVLRVET